VPKNLKPNGKVKRHRNKHPVTLYVEQDKLVGAVEFLESHTEKDWREYFSVTSPILTDNEFAVFLSTFDWESWYEAKSSYEAYTQKIEKDGKVHLIAR